jgi:hypothetical protein
MFLGTHNDARLAGRIYPAAPSGTDRTDPYTPAVPSTPSQVALMLLGGSATWAAASVWDQDIAQWWATTDDFLSMRRIVQELRGLPGAITPRELLTEIPAATADELRLLYPVCPVRTDGHCSICGSNGWCTPSCSRWAHTASYTETWRRCAMGSRTPLPLARRIVADPDGFRAAVMAAVESPGSALAEQTASMRGVSTGYLPPVDDMILCARMAMEQARIAA